MMVKKMKKTICLLIPIFIILLLCSCGEKNTDSSLLTVDLISDALISKLNFEITPEEIDSAVALSDYAIDELLVSEVRYFRVGSAVADEIAVFNVKNADDIPSIENAVSERIKYLKEGFSDYKPSEVPKIENAYTKTIGNIVILCICDDISSVDGIISSL